MLFDVTPAVADCADPTPRPPVVLASAFEAGQKPPLGFFLGALWALESPMGVAVTAGV